MAKIFIFRHGQTGDNIAKIFSGWRDVDLDESGIQEAEEIGERLKDEKVTKSYCSDLIRSKHTLEIVLKPHPNTPITSDPRIKERDYGQLDGTSKTELKEKDPKDFQAWHRSYTVAPPGGESLEMVEKRVMPFLQELLAHLSPDDIIFISAHGNSIRPMRKHFEHMSNEEMSTYEYQPAEVFSYEI